MSGTRVTATDIETGESESVVIEDNFVVICDGKAYISSRAVHANGTTQLTIKLDGPR